MDKETLLNQIGVVPNEQGLKKTLRFHQGWWRAFVLTETQGANPARTEENVCNTILNGKSNKKNFLTDSAIKSVEDTLIERQTHGAGSFNTDRLYNNLLSSQPLAFNFFGSLKQDLEYAKRVISAFIPEITAVTNVFFEYAPVEKYTNDNSAFDVVIEIEINDSKGLLGLEVKYTDSFSKEPHRKKEYEDLYNISLNFNGTYDVLTSSRFNQLFRNQLIAEALLQNKKYDFMYTGLFCYEGDKEAIETAREFQKLIKKGEENFKIITYADFISATQKQELTWQQREESMMLWARYSGLGLSQQSFNTCSGI